MLSIGSFSKTANITPKTLRYYDEIGLLKPKYVDSATGYRFYGVSQLTTVLLISRLKAYGFSLEEIATVLQNPGDNNALLPAMRQKQAHLQGQIKSYTLALSQMERDIENLERGNTLMSYLDTIHVELTETQPVNILSVRKEMNPQKEYAACLTALMRRVAEEKLTPAGPPLSIFHSEEYNPEHYDMEIGIPVKEAVKGTRALPGGPCARATLRGAYDGLPSVYAKVREWIEANGYIIAAPAWESYLTDPGQTPPAENVTEVYTPVKKPG